MDINSIIDRLNNELDKLNNLKNRSNIDTNTFFTSDENFNNDFSFDDTNVPDKVENLINSDTNVQTFEYTNIEPDAETTSLVTLKERHLLTVQNMFKKSIRISLKSFLISISLSFLNLFI